MMGEGINYESLIQDLDQDGDGKVNYEEFSTACYNRIGLLNDENLRLAFD